MKHRPKRETATYLYCLVKAATAPRMAKAPAGLKGTGRPRALDAGRGLWLIVADAPLDRFGGEAIERGLEDLKQVSDSAIAHEAIAEHFARAGTVIPMKLFTLFDSEERALQHISKLRPKIERVATRIAGCEEWGVRVWRRSRPPVVAPPPAAGRRGGKGAVASGTGFLLEKKRERDAVQQLGTRSRDDMNRIFDELAAPVTDARRRSPGAGLPEAPGTRLLLDAVFLVPTRRVAAFKKRVQALGARSGAEGYELALTGPWPPYNFIAEAA